MGPLQQKNVPRNGSPIHHLPVDQTNPNSDLRETQLLLRLIHHRNKNQHRTQKWWKWVCTLQRSVRNLLEIEEKQNERGGWMRREDEEKKQRLERWVRDIVISRAWVAFSTVVADNQFSALGIVLIAVLARVGKICGLPETKAAPIDVGDRVKAAPGFKFGESPQDAGNAVSREPWEDLGKSVQRSTLGSQHSNVSDRITAPLDTTPIPLTTSDHRKSLKLNDSTTMRSHKTEKPSASSRPMKRRKRGNAIDDLFDGLL